MDKKSQVIQLLMLTLSLLSVVILNGITISKINNAKLSIYEITAGQDVLCEEDSNTNIK